MRTLSVIVLTLVSACSIAVPLASQEGVVVHGGNAETFVNYCSAAEKMDPQTKAVPQQDVQAIEYCFGYILGVVDLHNVIASATKAKGYCVPENASTTQLAKVIVKFGADHPEELNSAAIVIVSDALSNAFPCN